MSVAQRLYEGVELGDAGTTALITYMRTDSVRVSDEARDAARDIILKNFGPEYYPDKPNFYKTKSSAQDAHEAIRPVDPSLDPEQVKHLLPRDQYSLYKIIWERFMASQMAPARFWDTTVTIQAADTQWRVKGERLLFPGFMAAAKNLGAQAKTELPKLAQGQILDLREFAKEQKFTQPPPRYSEASLVRELEEKGIGRPSTYAAIISTLIDRDYTWLDDKHFAPTDLGITVSDLLAEHFPSLMDVDFTATMENTLDEVAEGRENWVALMHRFTGDFYPTLDKAKDNMARVKAGLETGIACELCGKEMRIKFGKAGTFLACSGYPTCKNTRNFHRDDKGVIQVEEKLAPNLEVMGRCPACGGDLVLKRARTGSRFIACANYPDCTHAEPFTTGVPCPREGCDGELVERSSKRGKLFFSCNRYPQCDYAVWDWPINEPCPECSSKILVRKTTRAKGEHIACPEKSCRYTRSWATRPTPATTPTQPNSAGRGCALRTPQCLRRPGSARTRQGANGPLHPEWAAECVRRWRSRRDGGEVRRKGTRRRVGAFWEGTPDAPCRAAAAPSQNAPLRQAFLHAALWDGMKKIFVIDFSERGESLGMRMGVGEKGGEADCEEKKQGELSERH